MVKYNKKKKNHVAKREILHQTFSCLFNSIVIKFGQVFITKMCHKVSCLNYSGVDVINFIVKWHFHLRQTFMYHLEM